MKLFHGSIRKKLIILVLFATTPVFLVLLATELVNRQHALIGAKKDAAIFLNGFAEVQRRSTDSTRTLLRTVANIPEIREGHVEKSRVILATMLEANPIFTNAILVDMQGDVVAAGKNQHKAKQFNYADRKQFSEAIASNGFASGEFVVGKSSKKSIFPFGMAVLNRNGMPNGAIIIGVNLDHYGRLYERGIYPENSFFGVCDHKGLRLFRYPFSEKTNIGMPIKDTVFQATRIAGGAGSGSVIALASDGVKRLIVFESIRLGDGKDPYMYVFMGHDYDQIQARANGIIYRLFASVCLSLMLALGIAWLVGGTGIARRVEKLTWMTQKLGRGEENVTSGIDYADGELGSLARSFDNMVLMLGQKEKERIDTLVQLKASEHRFREIIEGVSAISIQGYDEQRNTIFWNLASEKIYGYTQAQALGKKLEELIIPMEMKEEVKKLHTQWIEKGEKIPAGELILVDKFGNDVPVFSSHVMHETSRGKEMFCIDIDLKPLKQSETDKKQLLDRLRQSQKMEAIGTLAGGIAHDFNNILVPILGHVEILLDEAEGDNLPTNHPSNHPAKDSLNQIYSSTLRAKELVQQILTFSRQEITEYKPIKIQLILKEVTKLLRSTIPWNIEIKQSVDSSCPALNANGTQIHQIIMNLATNAFHAMGDGGGELKIQLNTLDIDSGDSKDLGIRPGKVICLRVADTGMGMAPEVTEKIFDPFFTTKDNGKGTGMGLSVVHGIVKRMNGCIILHSTLGQGTEFKLYFPIEPSLSLKDKQEEKMKSLIVKGTESVLIVDDEEAILHMEQQALERLGYTVQSKNSPAEALETFKSNPDQFDLVITDMSMPGMSGDELASGLLTVRPDIPILLCTGFSEKITPEIAKNMGLKAVIMKPFSIKKLTETVRKLLDGTI